MSEYTIKSETAATAALQNADAFGMIENSSSRYKYTTGAQLKATNYITLTSSATTLSATLHAGNIVNQSFNASAWTITLPASAGTGNKYTVVLATSPAISGCAITRNNSSEVFSGYVYMMTTASAQTNAYSTTATDNIIKLNGSTTGGLLPTVFEFVDVATNLWLVTGRTAGTGTYATPFAHT